MALDLGTLYVNIRANTADTQRDIDSVKSSLAGIKSESNNTSAALSQSFDSMGGDITKATGTVTTLLNGVKGGVSGILGAVSSVAGSIPVVGGVAAAAIGLVSTAVANQEKALEEYKTYLSNWANEVDNWNTEATVSGLSSEAVQFYNVVSDLSDVEWGTIETGMKQLKKSIIGASDGSNDGAVQAFQALGVSLTNPDGSERSLEDIFNDTIVALQGMPEGIEKTSLSTKIFGEEAQKLNPILNMSTESFSELKTAYAEAYAYIDDKKLGDLQAFQDAKDLLAMYTDALELQKAGTIAPFETIVLKAEMELTKVKAEALETGVIKTENITEAGAEGGEAAANEAATVRVQERTEKWIDRINDYAYNKAYHKAATTNENATELDIVWENVRYGIDNIKNFGTFIGSWFSSNPAAKEYRRNYAGYTDYDSAESYTSGELDNAIDYLIGKYEESLKKLELQFESSSMTTSAYVSARKSIEEQFDADMEALTGGGAKELGQQWTEGYAEGVTSEEGTIAVQGAAQNIIAEMEDATATAQDSHSPSKVAAKYGLYWSQGLAQGILSGAQAVKAAASFVVNGTSDTNQTVNVNQNNYYSGTQSTFAAQYFSEKRLAKQVAAAMG